MNQPSQLQVENLELSFGGVVALLPIVLRNAVTAFQDVLPASSADWSRAPNSSSSDWSSSPSWWSSPRNWRASGAV
jgi:hypothetical protein